MRDSQDRAIHYLRVSVTDRCNFRCAYCMPPRGVKWLPHADILSYEELLRLLAVFSRAGIRNVRLTGGEPLVRKGFVDFVAAVRGLGTIEDLSMTTNGSLLPQFAPALKAAGLDRVNISLDTVDPAGFAKVTYCGKVTDTLRGIESALAAGLTPLKINVVLTEALSAADLGFFVDQVRRHPVAVRFIERMPLGKNGLGAGPDVAAVRRMIEEAGQGRLEPASIKGNGPARYWRLPRSLGTFGFITPISEHFCNACNRLRLTADGRLRPCLLSDAEIDVRTPLRAGASDGDLAELFAAAVRAKPAGHSLCRTSGYPGFARRMSQIGG